MKNMTVSFNKKDPRLAHIDSWLDREIEAGCMSGATLQIHHRGQLIYSRAAGFRDFEKTETMTLNTIFWIASMTKPITSVAALMLAEKGKLLLSEPVETYLPEFKGIPVMKEGVIDELVATNRPPTIQDLLRHTSGLTYGQFGTGSLNKAYQETEVYSFSKTNADMSKRLASLPLLHQPGTHFEYGMSTDLLGRVIEEVSGESLAAFFEKRIFAPLSMKDTGFDVHCENGSVPVARMPKSMQDLDLVPPLDQPSIWHSGGGGLWSTAPDYMRFALMLLGKGQFEKEYLVSPLTVRHMMSNHLPPDICFGDYTPELGITAPDPANGNGFGLGVAVRTDLGRNPAPGSVGEVFWPGVSGTNFWIDPKEQLAVVFMAHAAEWRTKHRSALRQLVYQALPE